MCRKDCESEYKVPKEWEKFSTWMITVNYQMKDRYGGVAEAKFLYEDKNILHSTNFLGRKGVGLQCKFNIFLI